MVPSIQFDDDNDIDNNIVDDFCRADDDDIMNYDDSDDSYEGFGAGSHIYGGIIYSDSNGMQGIDGDIYSSSPMSSQSQQNLTTLPSYVPDVEQLATHHPSNATAYTLDSITSGDHVDHVTSQYHDMSNYHGNQHSMQQQQQFSGDSQYQWNQQDGVGMTSSSTSSAFLAPPPNSYQLPHHHHQHIVMPSDYNYHVTSSDTDYQQSGHQYTVAAASSGQSSQQRSRPHGNSKKQQNATGKPQKPKGTPGRKVKVPDYELSPAEAKKRHIRRERNKVAAAKCRNRRRELTDRLQGETDELQKQFHQLSHEERQLQHEKERLEYILKTHAPRCNKQPTATPSASNYSFSTNNSNQYNNSHDHYQQLPPLQGIETTQLEEPAINTPVCSLVTPSHLSTQAFTFPSSASTTSTYSNFNKRHDGGSPPVGAVYNFTSSSTAFSQSASSSAHHHQHHHHAVVSSCSTEHRQRNSSSSAESLESNQSPNLLTL